MNRIHSFIQYFFLQIPGQISEDLSTKASLWRIPSVLQQEISFLILPFKNFLRTLRSKSKVHFQVQIKLIMIFLQITDFQINLFLPAIYYRMIKPNSLQIDHLELNFTNPFLTLPLQTQIPPSNKSIESTCQPVTCQPGISITNIQFGDNRKQRLVQQKTSRIHGKQAIKKIATTHYLLLNKQRKLNNQQSSINNTTLKSKIKISEKKLLESKYKSIASEFIENKQIQLDQQLKLILTNRKNNQIKQNKFSGFKYKRINTEITTQVYQSSKTTCNLSVSEEKYKKSIQSTSKDNQPKKDKKKQENGFYKKLKEKLQNQMQKLQDKNNKNKENFLVSGCEVFKCSNISQVNHRSLTDRPRPQTALSRAGLEIRSTQNLVKDRRPKSSRSRTLQRKQMQYIINQSKDIFETMYEPKKKIRKSSKQKSQSSFQPFNSKTLRHVTPIHKQSNYTSVKGQIQKEKVKEKMINLLMQCEDEVLKYNQLQTGLKAFQSYTKRMNSSLDQNSNILVGLQKQDLTFDE